MGMYDEVEVLYHLPGPTPKRLDDFQTKSLECGLHRYRIDAEGRLWQLSDGWTGETFAQPKQCAWHGYIHLVGEEYEPRRFRSYRVKFTDDVCVGIELLD